MATAATYEKLLDSTRPPVGEPLANIGTSLVVCNTDSTTATTNPTDPWLVTAHASHANIRPMRVPLGARFMEVYHVYKSSNATSLVTNALTVTPIIQAFGRLTFDFPNTNDPGVIWPYTHNSTNFPGPLPSSKTFFIPLADPTASSSGSRYLVTVGAAHTVSSAILPLCNYDVVNATATNRVLMSAPALFEVGGCDLAQVHIATAATIQATGAGLLVARFVK